MDRFSNYELELLLKYVQAFQDMSRLVSQEAADSHRGWRTSLKRKLNAERKRRAAAGESRRDRI